MSGVLIDEHKRTLPRRAYIVTRLRVGSGFYNARNELLVDLAEYESVFEIVFGKLGRLQLVLEKRVETPRG